MAGVGTATIDFGSTPTDVASVTVTGQTGIVGTCPVEAWIMGSTTGDHGPDEHLALGSDSIPVCGNIVPGTGFTITLWTNGNLYTGQFTLQWVWTDN